MSEANKRQLGTVEVTVRDSESTDGSLSPLV